MAEDHQGNFWFGHFNNGALVWQPEKNTWWIPDASQGFISKYITSIVADTARKTVYLGSEDYGLFRHGGDSGRFELYEHDPAKPDKSLGAYIVFDLCLDTEGHLWVATDPGGVSRFDPDAPKGQEFSHVRAADGLPSNRATSLGFDQRGRLWVCTLGGLACLDKATGRMRAFTHDDGLPKEFLDQRPFLLQDGSMIISTIYGYFRFHPDSLLRENPKSRIHLTSFKVFDSELGDSLLLGSLDQLQLSWRQNFFQFEFASSDILAAGKTQYAYRLQGFDAAWIPNGHRHVGSYTNVPPGDYVLEVKSGTEGRWNPTGLRLLIKIAPPFWQTGWFRALAVLTFVMLIYGIYRIRIRQIRREETLKTEFNQQIARTEMAALRAQMNPHFVFNCLSSINRFIMVNQPEEASAYLTKFARLIRLILDNSRTETVLLSKELEALKLYIEMEQMRFADRFDY
ncbi:MAG TPA: histidine kinase, partial [Bacteroidia bacterium]|nr:histidine kinase [Bacteroidia bacterium]